MIRPGQVETSHSSSLLLIKQRISSNSLVLEISSNKRVGSKYTRVYLYTRVSCRLRVSARTTRMGGRCGTNGTLMKRFVNAERFESPDYE